MSFRFWEKNNITSNVLLIYYVILNNGVKLIIIKAQKGGGAVRENSASLRITKGIISNSGVNNKRKSNINKKYVSPEKNMCWEKRVPCENRSGYHFCAVVIVNILVVITFLGISTRSNDLC